MSMLAGDDDLIDLIYAAMVGDARWDDFLALLANGLPDGTSTLFHHDITSGVGAWQLTHGLLGEVNESYAAHYSRLNPWMPAAAVRPIGLGVTAEQMYPLDSFVTTEFYHDFMRPIGVNSAIGVTIARDNGKSMLLSVGTSRADPKQNRMAADQLTRLAPHLRRVVNYYRSGPRQRAVSEFGASIFDAVDVGIVVVCEARQASMISKMAEDILYRTPCLRVGALGRVRLIDEEADKRLGAMLQRTYDGDRQASFFGDKVKMTLILVQKNPISAYFEGPTVLVLIEATDRKPAADLDGFAVHFRLTRTEKAVLSELVAGWSVNEIAERQRISRETVRSHLKRIFHKTGSHSQGDLIRIAARSVVRRR